ncbi:MAG: AAA family ATPase [Gemmiger sp.]|uniref:AAA family ATPase n=1 Tax=Gemmiger sp. TaxID=2049027 RepID=UPI002A90FCE1|nr:AAA family ATPase [Gemmiger sp.]MDY5411792.1 AAA family ATPase [Gemmiger sp.]
MTTSRLPKTITAGALLATPIPPVKWIIPGLLPAGLAIFAGPSKAGKSWLTLWLCLQISQGKSVWGREIEPRTVLYFSLEDTLGRLQERLYQLVDAEEDPERLILQTESHGIGQGLEEQIVSFVHTYPDISLIVIDTLQKVRKSDQNGSMYANDYKDIGALKELADKYGICILLVHHLRKQSSSDPYDQISGSTGIMGVADTTWLMHRQRMSKTATIRVIGRDMDEKMLHIREENCIWTLDEEETAEQQALKAIPDYLWKVADYIDLVGKWQGTATELLVAANISDVKPNQFTRKMAHYARDIFSPRGIEYKYTRTEQKRLFEFFHDDDAGDDDDIDISELFHWGIPQTSSSSSASSLRSLEGSKHSVWISKRKFGAHPKPRCAAAARQPSLEKQETVNKENFIFTVYSKKYFSTLKIEYSAQSVRSTESERGMLAPGWPLWPERFHNDPRKIPSATGISSPGPFEW